MRERARKDSVWQCPYCGRRTRNAKAYAGHLGGRSRRGGRCLNSDGPAWLSPAVRPTVDHLHDRGLRLPDGSRGCFGCAVAARVEGS